VIARLLALLDELDAARDKATYGWNRLGGTHDRTVINYVGEHVCDTAREVDAALIVAAVNALPKLTAALRAALDLAEQYEQEAAGVDQALRRFSRLDNVGMEMRRAASTKRDTAGHIRAALEAGMQEKS
jgi:hypothetical protein